MASALIDHVLQTTFPTVSISPSGKETLLSYLEPVYQQITTMPIEPYIQSLPVSGELRRRARAEWDRTHTRTDLAEFIFIELIDAAARTAESLYRKYSSFLNMDPNERPVIGPYSIYLAISQEVELSVMFRPPQFTYLSVSSPSYNLGFKFNESYLDPDLLFGLNNYLDAFIRNAMNLPPQQIMPILSQVGMLPENPNHAWMKYVTYVCILIRQKITQYAQSHPGIILNFNDLLSILSKFH